MSMESRPENEPAATPAADAKPAPNRYLVVDLIIVTIIGTLVGLIGSAPGGLLAGWVAGLACAFSLLGMLRLTPRADAGWVMFGEAVASGAIAGLAWWLVAQTTVAWYTAVLVAAGLVGVFLLVGARFGF